MLTRMIYLRIPKFWNIGENVLNTLIRIGRSLINFGVSLKLANSETPSADNNLILYNLMWQHKAHCVSIVYG